MTELMMICNGRALVPATEHDHALMRANYKIGQAVKTETKRQADRSLQHHRLYFGGLIGLIKDYWEPEVRLINRTEERTASAFCAYLQLKTALTTEQVQALKDDFLAGLSESRAERFTPLQPSNKDINEWIKIQAGYFDLVVCADGTVVKKAKSISFAKMTQTEFNEFYKAAFSVAWRFVLSRHFECEADAENAINRMLDMAA